MPTVTVDLPGRRYPIVIGAGRLDELPRRLAPIAGSGRLLVVADRNAYRHHGARLLRLLKGRFPAACAIVPSGESSKSLAWAERLYEQCRRHEIGRDGVILAFGGGVVGDLAGHVAATWQRGIALVMVPTTLLSQVDSSVGGKVGVNFGRLKNLIGAFHQPKLVLSDPTLLRTLPRREYRSALAEIVKYGMIADPGLLDTVERWGDRILAGDPVVLERVVTRCCRIKAAIVAKDEREGGVRAWLNYGHTLGHALEGAAAGRLKHGEAVALGMRGAARLGVRLGFLTPFEADRQDRLLDRLGLPRTAGGLSAADVLANLKWDKKVRGRSPRFVLTRGVGSASLAPPIEAAQVRHALAALLRR